MRFVRTVAMATLIVATCVACKCKQHKVSSMDEIAGPVEGGTEITFEGEKLNPGKVAVSFEFEDGTEAWGIVNKDDSTKTELIVTTPPVSMPGLTEVTVYKCLGKDNEKTHRPKDPILEFTFYRVGNDEPAEVLEAEMGVFALGDSELPGSLLVEVGDVIDGALLDCVAAGHGKVTVFQGDGAGGLTAVQQFDIDGTATDLLLADLDGDGADDAAVTLGNRDQVVVFLNAAGAGFHDDRRATYPVGTTPVAVEAADMDLRAEPSLDLIVGNRNSGDLTLLANSGTGEFSLLKTRRVPPPVPGGALVPPDHALVRALAAADFDQDGIVDVAVGTDTPDSTEPTPRIEVMLNRSSFGSFSSMWYGTPMTIAAPIQALAAADFSRGDGFADLAVLTEDRVVFHDSDALGAPFSMDAKRATVFDEGTPAARGLRAGNFFSTSEADVVVSFLGTSLLTLPHPTHEMAGSESVLLGASPVSMAAGLLDERGGKVAFDVVFAVDGGETIYVALNHGDGFD